MKKGLAILCAVLMLLGVAGCNGREDCGEMPSGVQSGVQSDTQSDVQSDVQSDTQSGAEQTPVRKSKAEYMHISFDDTQTCFRNLAVNGYESVWEEPFFAWLFQLRERYGARFSLYTYTSVLQGVGEKYAKEFQEASEWLKMGFHADTSGHNLSEISYQTGKAYWNAFVAQVARVTGGVDNLDRLPRLEFFSGSKDALLGMRDGDCGAVGFLSADDSRNSYYFTEQETEYLYTRDCFTDGENGLVFFATDIRGDWFSGNFSTQNAYRKPLKATVRDELVYRERTGAFDEAWKSVIFFTHEWQVYDGQSVNVKGAWAEQACDYAREFEIPFDYPQNRT